MSTYKNQPWSSRIKTMGDTAETAFESVHPSAHRLGMLRPTFDTRHMRDTMRYAPDYMLPDGLYEVMGCASRGDSMLKTRFDKLTSMSVWQAIGPVNLWIWDSSKKRYWVAPLADWVKAFHKFGVVDRFPDNNKPYFALHIDYFPTEPIRHDIQP
jgi:hypothetical protein